MYALMSAWSAVKRCGCEGKVAFGAICSRKCSWREICNESKDFTRSRQMTFCNYFNNSAVGSIGRGYASEYKPNEEYVEMEGLMQISCYASTCQTQRISSMVDHGEGRDYGPMKT